MSAHDAALVLQTVAGRRADPDLLDVMLRLFDGHDTPAMWWSQPNRRVGFYPIHGITRQLAFEAHLLGAVTSGVYPFRGVTPWCSCARREHVCDGLGTRYICVDLDAKNGEQDIEARTRNVLRVCWKLNLLPVVFSSRSGKGAHVFLFLNRSVSTRDAFRAGKRITSLAGVVDRCDVIPSAEHRSGFGTLHALPFGALSASGGGVLFDSHLRPVPRESVVSTLRWVEQTRSPADVIEDIARGELTLDESSVPALKVTVIARRNPASVSYSRGTPLLSPHDADILKSMRNKHPQFRRALATPAERWRGGRSSRDAYLVGYLRRQGVSAAGVVRALLDLPGTKTADRGEDYAWALVESQVRDELRMPLLAGQPLQPAAAKKQQQEGCSEPWAARLNPPNSYGEVASPWWRADVQKRLKPARGVDGIVLAYLVDRYYRGPVRRRMFFCGRRELGTALRVSANSVGAVVRRLAVRFPDVLRVVDGVPHPKLRIARGFYVPEAKHRDPLDWQLEPVRSHQGMLVCGHGNPRGVARHGGDQLEHARSDSSDELPF